jgi:alpha-beta hydrolase superfamily lysophospholipase
VRRSAALAGCAVVVASAVIVLGPRARLEGGWIEPDLPADLDAYLASREARFDDVRPQARRSIVWHDEQARAPTAVAVVYLHGFSADRHEVEPLVSDLAEELGANVYFARLAGHGRPGAAMAEAGTAEWLADASEAVAVGARIGERVLLVGTSTGATLALWAAAQEEARGRVDGLVLISPNLGLREPSAGILTLPWGGVAARLVVGRQRCFEPETEEQTRHWTVCYPTRALLPMAALVRHVRRLDLSTGDAPTLVVYSPDDQVVDPDETLRILASMGERGPEWHVVQGSGDPAQHVIAGAIMSPGTTDLVRRRVLEFLKLAGFAREGG